MLDRDYQNDRPLELWDDGVTLVGYAAVFYREGDESTEYRPFSGMVERVMPGAFRNVISQGDEVLGLVNHDMAQVLGRRSAGTLTIDEDKIGLRYKLTLADTTLARDTAANVRHGNFGGSSIGFRAAEDGIKRTSDDGDVVRTITDVATLRDVGPVTEPAFRGTSVMARCAKLLEVEYLAELRDARMAELQKQFEEAT